MLELLDNCRLSPAERRVVLRWAVIQGRPRSRTPVLLQYCPTVEDMVARRQGGEHRWLPQVEHERPCRCLNHLSSLSEAQPPAQRPDSSAH